jgi:mannosyl-oligosaccharide alpha-1,2-mannosidase
LIRQGRSAEPLQKTVILQVNDYTWNLRSLEVIDAFRHAWKGYKEHAWGLDELQPIQKTGTDRFGLGLTILDSLDTSFLMNETEIFNEAKEWVTSGMKFDYDAKSNVFELTIRGYII